MLRTELLRNAHGEFGRDRGELAEASRHSVSAVGLLLTDGLPSTCAELAGAARGVQPRHSHVVPHVDALHFTANLDNNKVNYDGNIMYLCAGYLFDVANAFVTRAQWQLGLRGPVALHRMHISVAETAHLQFHQNLITVRLGDVSLLGSVSRSLGNIGTRWGLTWTISTFSPKFFKQAHFIVLNGSPMESC